MKYKIMSYGLLTLATIMVGCSPVRTFRKMQSAATVRYTEAEQRARKNMIPRDTISKPDTTNRIITFTRSDGTKAYFTEAVYDSVSDSRISVINISAVTISAQAVRRVAERNGKINIGFQLIVPAELQRNAWQVDLQPKLRFADGQVDSLEAVLLTGFRFRAQQYNDYADYYKYTSKIIPDSADFFGAYGYRSAYHNYLRGMDRRRSYLQERLQAKYRSYNGFLAERFLMFNGINFQKDTIYEKYISTQQRLIAMRKRPARAEAVADTTQRHRGLTDQQTATSGSDYNPLETRSLYDLGGWFPFHHHSLLRDENEAGSRDSLIIMRRREEIAEIIKGLDRTDSAEIAKRFVNYKKVAQNKKRMEEKERMFHKLVPHPFRKEVRLDSVLNVRGELRYYYSQELTASDNTSKLQVYLDGSLRRHNGMFYRFNSPDTLLFSVSSMTSFVDETPRYVQRIITRDAEANARFSIEFPVSKSRLNEQFGNNARELRKVKDMIAQLMNDPIYIIDSIRIMAASSPEGTLKVNKRLAQERSAAFSDFMKRELTYWRDSLDVQTSVVLNDDNTTTIQRGSSHLPDLESKVRFGSIAEDWDKLSEMIAQDDSLLRRNEEILKIIDDVDNLDRREIVIRRAYPSDYATLRKVFYPRLRAVDVKFNLLRRGMLQDTIYTTELDSTYTEGVRLLKARQYAAAIEILRPYEDVNTALAYMSLGYDAAALRVFSQQKPTDNIIYAMAILYARKGDDANAVQQLLRAVELTPQLRFRANLDPELAALVQRYNIFAD